jgi:hypothetical protein
METSSITPKKLLFKVDLWTIAWVSTVRRDSAPGDCNAKPAMLYNSCRVQELAKCILPLCENYMVASPVTFQARVGQSCFCSSVESKFYRFVQPHRIAIWICKFTLEQCIQKYSGFFCSSPVVLCILSLSFELISLQCSSLL